jgi:hypothetical protein
MRRIKDRWEVLDECRKLREVFDEDNSIGEAKNTIRHYCVLGIPVHPFSHAMPFLHTITLSRIKRRGFVT